MAKKWKDLGKRLIGPVAVTNSFDGAEHYKSEKYRTNIISFSSRLTGKSVLEQGGKAGGESDILTW